MMDDLVQLVHPVHKVDPAKLVSLVKRVAVVKMARTV